MLGDEKESRCCLRSLRVSAADRLSNVLALHGDDAGDPEAQLARACRIDDYHHLPFIFGAAQLCGFETASSSPFLPKHVVQPHHVRTHRADFFYFDNISWIFENKNGPFHEHSNVLYSWNKIAGGMINMYDGEVLGKFNVIQHFLFGSHFAIAEDAAAVALPA